MTYISKYDLASHIYETVFHNNEILSHICEIAYFVIMKRYKVSTNTSWTREFLYFLVKLNNTNQTDLG